MKSFGFLKHGGEFTGAVVPHPPGDLRLTDQLGGKGVQLLFGNKYREDPHRQRNDQHSAEDKDTHIQISLAAL